MRFLSYPLPWARRGFPELLRFCRVLIEMFGLSFGCSEADSLVWRWQSPFAPRSSAYVQLDPTVHTDSESILMAAILAHDVSKIDQGQPVAEALRYSHDSSPFRWVVAGRGVRRWRSSYSGISWNRKIPPPVRARRVRGASNAYQCSRRSRRPRRNCEKAQAPRLWVCGR